MNVDQEWAAMVADMMRGMLIFLLIYLHLFIGLIAGIVILWRIKTKRRWWGALLSYVCLLLIVSLPFVGGVVVNRSSFTSSTTVQCLEGCSDQPMTIND